MTAPYSDPLAFFLTWSAYGSWLPGDDRGWVPRGGHVRLPDPERLDEARRAMTEPALTLSAPQRVAVEEVIRRHCDLRGWTLHAANVRTTHVHVVVTAPEYHPKKVREEFKSWGTRTLKNPTEPAAAAGGPTAAARCT